MQPERLILKFGRNEHVIPWKVAEIKNVFRKEFPADWPSLKLSGRGPTVQLLNGKKLNILLGKEIVGTIQRYIAKAPVKKARRKSK